MNRRKKKCKKFLILMEKSQLKSVGANYLGYYYFSFLFLYYALSAMDHQYHILYKYSNSLHIFCYYLHIFFSFEFVKTNYRQNFLIGEQRECPRYFKLIIYPEAFPLWRTRDAPITSPLLKRHVSKSITCEYFYLYIPRFPDVAWSHWLRPRGIWLLPKLQSHLKNELPIKPLNRSLFIFAGSRSDWLFQKDN